MTYQPDYAEFDSFDEFPQRFVVMAYRSSGSMFGAATAPCKGKNGQIQFYKTTKKAKADADRWNAKLTTKNVRYTVEAYE